MAIVPDSPSLWQWLVQRLPSSPLPFQPRQLWRQFGELIARTSFNHSWVKLELLVTVFQLIGEEKLRNPRCLAFQFRLASLGGLHTAVILIRAACSAGAERSTLAVDIQEDSRELV
ncbi:hypothetical protein N658DRAFT_562466 [Parathielavia hyrcaniae]|uniref:Uncharacterized protein n=1 Tax=Parathielavia hyrcaniae TaxID=113614 RepID=A0AAN6PRG4_9PEZI|nr:hypothetical protein N658DRAFT_562466 [Parathielavia hyrcaniae]